MAIKMTIWVADSAVLAQAHDTTADDSQCTLRCLHYPALGLDVPRGSWRAGSHTDFSTVTLLYQVLAANLKLASSQHTQRAQGTLHPFHSACSLDPSLLRCAKKRA